MRRLVAILIAALFSAVTFSAYAADPAAPDASTTQKPAKKKKKKSTSNGVSSQGQKMDQSGQGAGTPVGGGAVSSKGNKMDQSGQGAGAPVSGGAVTSPTPTGPGRADNQ